MANPITLSAPLPAEDLFFESMTFSTGLSSLGVCADTAPVCVGAAAIVGAMGSLCPKPASR